MVFLQTEIALRFNSFFSIWFLPIFGPVLCAQYRSNDVRIEVCCDFIRGTWRGNAEICWEYLILVLRIGFWRIPALLKTRWHPCIHYMYSRQEFRRVLNEISARNRRALISPRIYNSGTTEEHPCASSPLVWCLPSRLACRSGDGATGRRVSEPGAR